MTIASTASRQIFWHLTGGLKIVWYSLAIASVLVFVNGLVRPTRRWRRGRGGDWPPYPWRQLPGRVIGGARLVLTHSTIRRRDPLAGWAHGGIFYGWIVLFAGTVILAFQTDFSDPLFGWTYFHGQFYLVYKEVLNLLGTALVVGLLAMMVRRAVIRPRKLDYARPDRGPHDPQFDRRLYLIGDWVFVVVLLVIALTGFALEGVRIAMDHPGYGGTQFGGWAVAQALGGLGHVTLGALRHGLWWFHGLLAIALVASIPYTKAGHMMTGFASLALRDPMAGKRLGDIPPDRATTPAGYSRLEDFSPLHLMQLDACTKCGKCHEACPANATGRPLSPRDVILELREQANHPPADSGIGGLLGGLLDGRMSGASWSETVIGPRGVRSETIWSCMQCNACVEVCPVGIEQGPIINQMRRALVEEGRLAPTLQIALEAVGGVGNSFGRSADTRGSWTAALDFTVKDARREPVDVLWFVGDYASFDEDAIGVTQATARLFHAAGVDFGILFDGERNSGNDVRRVGEEGLFEALARHNIEMISSCQFSRIVTSDPHSLNALRNDYQSLGAEWDVIHHTDLLLELIESGELDATNRLAYRVTYHDPCHLGRFNGGYEAPRRILQLIGCELVEMPRNRENSFCCGAGGGRIWMPDQPGTERPSENRIREAVALGGLDHFVVACPKDATMYADAIRATGNADRITLREVTQLVEEALENEPALAVSGVTA
jgi:Fe-S oxidoreductase